MTTLIVFSLTFVASMLIVASRLRRTDALHRHERAMAVLRDMAVHDPEAELPGEPDRFHVRVVQGPLPPGAATRRAGRRAYAGSPSRSQAAASAARESHLARAAAEAGITLDADATADDVPPPPPPIRLRIDGLDELAMTAPAENGNGSSASSNGAGVRLTPSVAPAVPHHGLGTDVGSTVPGPPPRAPGRDAGPSVAGGGEQPATPPAHLGPTRPRRASTGPEPPRRPVPGRLRSALAGSARRTAVAAAAALVAAVTFSAAYSGGGDEAESPVERGTEAPAPPAAPTTEAPAPEPAAQLLGFDGRVAAYAVPPTFRLELGALDRCWVRIQSGDGAVLFEGIVEAGETRSFDLTSPADLRLGNAPVVGLTVDGTPLALPPGTPSTLTLTFAPSA